MTTICNNVTGFAKIEKMLRDLPRSSEFSRDQTSFPDSSEIFRDLPRIHEMSQVQYGLDRFRSHDRNSLMMSQRSKVSTELINQILKEHIEYHLDHTD